MADHYTPTQRVTPIDMDGNELALFKGYDAPAPAAIFDAFPKAVKITCKGRLGNIVQTFYPEVAA